MTGLENIINRIELDAKSRADEIAKKAQAEADVILKNAQALADDILADFEERAKTASADIVERGGAADEIEAKRLCLKNKQALILRAVESAKEEIKNASCEDYFEFLSMVLKNAAQKGTCGKLLLSAEDLSEAAEEFKAVAEESNLTLEQGAVSKRNGFVIVYGSIEINCTIDALFDAKAEEISDCLNELLFGSEGGV